MPYVSELLGRPVTDVNGEPIGRLVDIVASTSGKTPHPLVVAISVKRGRTTTAIPFHAVAVLIPPAIPLRQQLDTITPYAPTEHDLHLAQDVLDKQIIDTDGVRVVRVNDLELTRVNHHLYVANVDIGGLGLLRRLGLAKVVQRVARRFGRALSSNAISWDNVELLPGGQPMRLRVSSAKIVELHPADLAEIISDLGRYESTMLLESLDVKTVADTLGEVEPDFQASLIQRMADERAADVLEEMAPDEAADLLGQLPEQRSLQLLELMEDEEADDVRRLLAYPEDSAGGIMTTEYVAIPPDLTAQQAISALRETASEAETIFYVYVTDDDHRLIGLFSLRELVLAQPETPVRQLMQQHLVTVALHTSQDEVAQLIAKYNLLAVPVVDDQGRLQGIVTSDDALDKILPTAWKKRMPRLYH